MAERRSSSSRSGSSRPGARKGGSRGGMGRRMLKQKGCAVTAEKKGPIDYKDIDFLSRYITDR